MQVKENFEIKNLTSYKIGGKVKRVYFPESQSEFVELLGKSDDYIVLGSCSNVLFSSNGFDGDIILTTELKQYEIRGTTIFASSGVKGPFLAQKAAEAGLSGFEFMIGFPGSIGGNIYMNAGAHGQNISDNLVQCCLFDKLTKEVNEIAIKAYRSLNATGVVRNNSLFLMNVLKDDINDINYYLNNHSFIKSVCNRFIIKTKY